MDSAPGVEVKGGTTQNAEVRANSSFESASDPRTHFGLGTASKVDSIVVRWPSGKVDTVAGETADQELVIEEGRGDAHWVERYEPSRETDHRSAKKPYLS